MEAPKTTDAVACMTVNLSEELSATVRALARVQGVPLAEAVRRALSTEMFLTQRRAAGDTVVLRANDGTYKEFVPYAR